MKNIVIRLSKWSKLFPDGVSTNHYNRIGRIIRSLGNAAVAQLAENDHDQLESELTRIEKLIKVNQRVQ